MNIFQLMKLIVHFSSTGYVVQGSTGEFPYLSKEERVNLVRFVRKIASKEKLIIGGSGCECKYAVFCQKTGSISYYDTNSQQLRKSIC